MESTLWSNQFDLKSLLQDFKNYDFFQTVRLLQLATQNHQSKHTEPLKNQSKTNREIVRFQVPASFGFPEKTITNIKHVNQNDDKVFVENYYSISVNFFGLIGTCGVLPDHYTDMIIKQNKARDYASQKFLDIFQHRIISLYYKAWEKYKIPILYEKEKLFNQNSLIEKILSSLYGQGTKYLSNRLAVHSEFFMYFAGILSRQIRSVYDIENVLQTYFKVPVILKQFQEQQLQIPDQQVSRLGSQTDKPFNQLGKNIILGRYIKSINNSFRIKIGPLTFKDFCEFLPQESSLKVLKQLTNYMVNQQFNFDVQLILKFDEVPLCKLSSTMPLGLGWQTWLKTKPFKRNSQDVILKNVG